MNNETVCVEGRKVHRWFYLTKGQRKCRFCGKVWDTKPVNCFCGFCEGKEVLSEKCPCKKCKGCKIHLGEGHLFKDYGEGYCGSCYKDRLRLGQLKLPKEVVPGD
jgi:hypothetical protein